MVRQPFHLIVHPVPRQSLQRLDNARVQRPPPLVQQTPVRHLIREGVLEDVLDLGEEACLVQELGSLELRETAVQGILGQLGNGLQ